MYGESKPATYKLDIPVEMKPWQGVVYTIINKGLFRCKKILMEGDLEGVVVSSISIGKIEQLAIQRDNPPPAVVFDGKSIIYFDASPPGGAITFRFRNNGDKPAKFTVQLDGQEAPLL